MARGAFQGMKSRILLVAAFVLLVNCLLCLFFLLSIGRIRSLKDVGQLSIQTLSAWNEFQYFSVKTLLATENYRAALETTKAKRLSFAEKYRRLSTVGRRSGIGRRTADLLDSLDGLWSHIEKTISQGDAVFERMESEGVLKALPPNSIAGSMADKDFPNGPKLLVLRFIQQVGQAELPSGQFNLLLNDLVSAVDRDVNASILRWILWMLAVFAGMNGATFFLSYVFARRSGDAEKEMERVKAQLLHSQKMEAIGTLTGGIAHDFNNLLTVILGYGSTILERLTPGDSDYADMEQVVSTGRRAAELTKQLLTLSSRQVLEPHRYDINGIITGLRSLLDRVIGENIRLETALREGEIPVFVDKGQIEQIIINLAINAKDAMPDGGNLRIGTDAISIDASATRTIPGSYAGSFCRIVFADDGTGIPEEILGRIFEPFFTTKKGGKGTGLGLSVVYGIVQRHKGWITVRSEPGAGTAFTIFLPVAADGAQDATARMPKPRAAVPRAGTGRILLVEDDEQVRRFASRVLESGGYAVTQVPGVGAAMEAIGKTDKPFDLVFSDVLLKDGKGSDMAVHIHETLPHLKILLTSGYSELNRKPIDELTAGMSFLQKPYSSERLLQAVHAVLQGG